MPWARVQLAQFLLLASKQLSEAMDSTESFAIMPEVHQNEAKSQMPSSFLCSVYVHDRVDML